MTEQTFFAYRQKWFQISIRMFCVFSLAEDARLSTNLEGFDVFLIDEQHFFDSIDMDSQNLTIKKHQVLLLKRKKQEN